MALRHVLAACTRGLRGTWSPAGAAGLATRARPKPSESVEVLASELYEGVSFHACP